MPKSTLATWKPSLSRTDYSRLSLRRHSREQFQTLEGSSWLPLIRSSWQPEKCFIKREVQKWQYHKFQNYIEPLASPKRNLSHWSAFLFSPESCHCPNFPAQQCRNTGHQAMGAFLYFGRNVVAGSRGLENFSEYARSKQRPPKLLTTRRPPRVLFDNDERNSVLVFPMLNTHSRSAMLHSVAWSCNINLTTVPNQILSSMLLIFRPFPTTGHCTCLHLGSHKKHYKLSKFHL